MSSQMVVDPRVLASLRRQDTMKSGSSTHLSGADVETKSDYEISSSGSVSSAQMRKRPTVKQSFANQGTAQTSIAKPKKSVCSIF